MAGSSAQPSLGCSWVDREKVVVGTVNKPDSCMVAIKVHFANVKFVQPTFFSENTNGNCQFDICLIIWAFKSSWVGHGGKCIHQNSHQVGIVFLLALKMRCLPAKCHFLYYLFLLVSKLAIVFFKEKEPMRPRAINLSEPSRWSTAHFCKIVLTSLI